MNDMKINMKADIDKELEKLLQSHKTVIKVFGTGGGGNNTISRLIEAGTENVQTYAINTDAQDLLHAIADQKVLIGRDMTSGLGAGSDPKIGEQSALENEKELKEYMLDADLVFVTCGLGGGTGSGSAPVIASLAREVGALTVSIVTLPFSEEGVMRWNNAQYGLEKLRKNSDTLIVIENDRLLELDPDVSLDKAFHVADEILVNAVKGITQLVTQKGLVNLDFADIRTIMKDGGTALIGIAESDSPERAVKAVEKAIENPLIDLKIDGAKSALLNISGGTDMTIRDAKTAMHTLARKLDSSARIIWGARIVPELDNKVSVMILATGLKENSFKNVLMRKGGDQIIPDESDEYIDESPVDEDSTMLEEDLSPAPEDQEETAASFDPVEKKKEARKIFCEIMEEESDSDLKNFDDAIKVLQDKNTDKDQWEELRQASSSLAGTAHMFDFVDIAGFMNSAEDMLTAVIHKDFYYESVLEMFLDVPNTLRAMIRGEEDSIVWAKEFGTVAGRLATALREGQVDNDEAFKKYRDNVRHDLEKGEFETTDLANNNNERQDIPDALDASESVDNSSIDGTNKFAGDYVDDKNPSSSQ